MADFGGELLMGYLVDFCGDSGVCVVGLFDCVMEIGIVCCIDDLQL